MRALLASAVLFIAASAATAQEAPTFAKDFNGELKAMLEKSKAEKKGLEFNVGGQTVAGGVVAVLDDAVVVRNQQYGRVLIRLDKIDAVSGF